MGVVSLGAFRTSAPIYLDLLFAPSIAVAAFWSMQATAVTLPDILKQPETTPTAACLLVSPFVYDTLKSRARSAAGTAAAVAREARLRTRARRMMVRWDVGLLDRIDG